MFDPIRSGMRAFGSAVTAVPDSVYSGVTKVGDGFNKAAKQMMGNQVSQVCLSQIVYKIWFLFVSFFISYFLNLFSVCRK